MAEQDDSDKDFPATQKRLDQAREQGQVARSRELATAAVEMSAAIGLVMTGPMLFEHCLALVRTGLTLERDSAFASERMITGLATSTLDMLIAGAPLVGIVTVATLAAPLLLSGWVWSSKALAPDFSRLNPVRGLGGIFSTRGLAELVKAIIKCVLIGAIGVWTVMHSWDEMQRLAQLEPAAAVASLGGLLGTAFIALVAGLGAIALIDVPWQLWRHSQDLRMSREEIKEEMRESEGDPQIKARVRSQQREIARKRMMAAVPKADVIVTNPTHYAVALEYQEGKMRAPRIVAKGAGLIAQRIKEIGAEHAIPTLEAPPLARALFRHTEIGDEIPPALYTVVAQVLAYVYQLQRQRVVGGPLPVVPTDLDVPPGLDPLGTTAARPAGHA